MQVQYRIQAAFISFGMMYIIALETTHIRVIFNIDQMVADTMI